MDKQKKYKLLYDILKIQVVVLILALSFVSNKLASNYLAEGGLFDYRFILFIALYGGLTVVYAILWQMNLEKHSLSFMYINRNLYVIWSQIFAVLIFGNEISVTNVVGIALIILGVGVNWKNE